MGQKEIGIRFWILSVDNDPQEEQTYLLTLPTHSWCLPLEFCVRSGEAPLMLHLTLYFSSLISISGVATSDYIAR